MFRRIIRLALITLLLGTVLGACGDDDEGSGSASGDSSDTTEAAAEIQEMKITGQEYSYSGAAPVKAGYVKLTLENKGKEDHQAQLTRLNDGVTPQQLQEATTADPTGEKALALVSLAGGVNAIAPGTTMSSVTELGPGNYLMMCFLPTPDGKSTHVAQGMVAPFEVTGTAPEADEPKYDFEIEAKDFTFEIPDIESGEHTVEFKNNGPSPHEATLYKVADGKTAADVQKFLGDPASASGPPPFTAAGGASAITSGKATFPTWDLEPGTYAVTCFVPDQKSGKPHIALGMFASFDVK
jgi:hypothetical protein